MAKLDQMLGKQTSAIMVVDVNTNVGQTRHGSVDRNHRNISLPQRGERIDFLASAGDDDPVDPLHKQHPPLRAPGPEFRPRCK